MRSVGGCEARGREQGEALAVFTGGGFVEHPPEGKHVRAGCARAFGREVAGGADERAAGVVGSDCADVGELCHAADEDDVGGLEVAVDEFVGVEKNERVGERDEDASGLGGRQGAANSMM